MRDSWKICPTLMFALVLAYGEAAIAQGSSSAEPVPLRDLELSKHHRRKSFDAQPASSLAPPESVVQRETSDAGNGAARQFVSPQYANALSPSLRASAELDVSLTKPFPIEDRPTEISPEPKPAASVEQPLMTPPLVSSTPEALPIRSADTVVPTQPILTAQAPPQLPVDNEPSGQLDDRRAPALKLENLTTDFRNDSDGVRTNRIIEPTAQLKLPNGDRLQITTGWNTFQQSGIDTVQNFPLGGTWVRKLGDKTLRLGGGLDVFNRLAIQPQLSAELEVPLGVEVSPRGTLNRGVVLKGLVDYGAYKFNAKTLERGINVVHFKPEVYWQIDPKTSLYSHYRFGLYSDGNVEHQTYSRFERKFGDFFVAANLFTWNYAQDNEISNGYFSPRQFLTYNGEIGWAGDVTKGLRCRVTAALGQQTLNGNNSNISQYNGRCSAAIAPNIDVDFGYGFSNERKQTLNASNYQNHSVSAQLRMKF